MSNIPACQFGYLSFNDEEGHQVFVKANKITIIDAFDNKSTIISISEEHYIVVGHTVEQILEQLESIHPSLR